LKAALLKGNSEARKKFIEITDMYKAYNYRFVTTADTPTLTEYCIAWSEYIALQKTRKKLIKDSDKFDAWMKVESRIDKKNEVLIKLGSLLYLTPASRLKVHDVPDMKKPEKDRRREEEMFG
jgi:phage terminase small subunit